jgi:hypothetical protein
MLLDGKPAEPASDLSGSSELGEWKEPMNPSQLPY